MPEPVGLTAVRFRDPGQHLCRSHGGPAVCPGSKTKDAGTGLVFGHVADQPDRAANQRLRVTTKGTPQFPG